MKVWSTLALFVGFSTAASVLTTDRPYKISESSASVPEGAPADYHTDTISLTEEKSTNALSNVSKGQLQRRDALRKTRDPITAQDFYECATTV